MEKLKKSIKKSNRGLFLGLVLVIAVAVYTVIDNHNFKSEKPAIEKQVTDFVEQIGDYMVFGEEYRTTQTQKGKQLTDPEKEQYQSQWNKFIDQYWVYKDYSKNMYFWGLTIAGMKNTYQDVLNQLPDEYVTSYNATVGSVSIKKAGPECATCEAQVNIIVQTTDNASFVMPGSTENFGNYGYEEYYDPIADEFVKSDDSQMLKYSCDATFTFNLERVDGVWKITGADYDSMSMNKMEIDDQNQSEGDEN